MSEAVRVKREWNVFQSVAPSPYFSGVHSKVILVLPSAIIYCPVNHHRLQFLMDCDFIELQVLTLNSALSISVLYPGREVRHLADSVIEDGLQP